MNKLLCDGTLDIFADKHFRKLFVSNIIKSLKR